ncbi:uncharacterized protein LOC134945648 isoform X2 [Pseudophryne corroboree]|uniref:uncharacterized protein LOC134945648 isoform X2 n=1 Tax=Pseudophryne corroboree TaxID=495146 RepID=UPI00308195C8
MQHKAYWLSESSSARLSFKGLSESSSARLSFKGCRTIVIMSLIICVISLVLYPFACLGFTIKFLLSQRCFQPTKRVIGIFSRSDSSDYKWITQGLTSPMFKGLVEETRAVYISNSDHQFIQAARGCDFAVLYHTKNRGRVNITNVTDSIYDEQLRHLSDSKGKENVVVVIDDLEKSDFEEKHRILLQQPDIMECSRDLILVTQSEKEQPRMVNQKLKWIKDLLGSPGTVYFFSYLVSMTCWATNNVR